MKKIVYFIPAILFAAFYGLVTVVGFPVGPFVFLWIAALVVSGVLLSKAVTWGCCVGMLPGVHLMCMSTVDTGQILPIELPAGLIVVAFYALCGVFVQYRKQKVQQQTDRF